MIQVKFHTCVSAKGLEGCSSGTVCDIYLTVPSASTDQKAGLVCGVFQKTQISDGTVVHGKLYLFTFQVRRVRVEPHQFDRFVIGASGHEVANGRPGKAVYGPFVVFRPLEEDHGLVGFMVFPRNNKISN